MSLAPEQGNDASLSEPSTGATRAEALPFTSPESNRSSAQSRMRTFRFHREPQQFHAALEILREAHATEVKQLELEIQRLRSKMTQMTPFGATDAGTSIPMSLQFSEDNEASAAVAEAAMQGTTSRGSVGNGRGRRRRPSMGSDQGDEMPTSVPARAGFHRENATLLEKVLTKAEKDKRTIEDHELQPKLRKGDSQEPPPPRELKKGASSSKPTSPRSAAPSTGQSPLPSEAPQNAPQEDDEDDVQPEDEDDDDEEPEGGKSDNHLVQSEGGNWVKLHFLQAATATKNSRKSMANVLKQSESLFASGGKSPQDTSAIPFPQKANSRALTEHDGVYANFRNWVASARFEALFAGIIMLNSFVMAMESQYYGWEVGIDLGYPNSVDSAEVFPFAEGLFEALDWIFGLVFLVEVAFKIIAFKFRFFREPWHYFDTGLVVLWVMEAASSSGTAAIISPSTLRVFRLMKVLRLLRLVRSIQGFDSLYIMTSALSGSATVLAWSAAMLCLVLMMFALLANQVLVETYLTKEENPVDEKVEVYEYFGTFSRALLSMFEMTLANWPPVCRVLVENVSEAYLIPALAHKLTIGFAVVGVINGVFMQETFKVAATDDRIMVRQKQMAMTTHVRKMRALFERADDSGDGLVDLEEFRLVVSDPGIKTWLASMDLDASDVDMLFHIIDDDYDGHLTVDELVRGVSRLKGPARSIDLAVQMRDYKVLHANLEELTKSVMDLSRHMKDLSSSEFNHHFHITQILLKMQEVAADSENQKWLAKEALSMSDINPMYNI
mmetsp:Transcript_18242/g.42495  ORF Transcript_18242/g.42495 Transcript_18242/m.42495 type:complete len:782 (+) Transcript_18242:59-2404(+)